MFSSKTCRKKCFDSFSKKRFRKIAFEEYFSNNICRCFCFGKVFRNIRFGKKTKNIHRKRQWDVFSIWGRRWPIFFGGVFRALRFAVFFRTFCVVFLFFCIRQPKSIKNDLTTCHHRAVQNQLDFLWPNKTYFSKSLAIHFKFTADEFLHKTFC